MRDRQRGDHCECDHRLHNATNFDESNFGGIYLYNFYAKSAERGHS